ncbi:MAG: glycoside hydrolase domain-containing protein [Terriglobales bacterium]
MRLCASILVVAALFAIQPTQAQTGTSTAYLGFDRNNYPGDQNLKALRQTFSFAGYWLSRPPSARSNTWAGKRARLQAAGFGFLVLFNGRLYADLKTVSRAAALGKADARAAALAANREGFPGDTIIFLDQEQGGRMLPEQKAYIYAWVDGVIAAGFRAGIYCSGIAFQESPDVSIVTAQDIRRNAGGRKIVYFVVDDACPPAPGCVFPRRPPSPIESGIGFAEVWQFAQSPRRIDVSAGCPATHNRDGNCYPPGVNSSERLHVDLDSSSSPDPSHGRSR